MTEHQRLFLVQARSDYTVYQLLLKRPELPTCHALHYLQMATELLGKAFVRRRGPGRKTHRALVGFLRSLMQNRQAQRRLGFGGRNENWEHLLRKMSSLAERIEDLAPALSLDGPNPEYPWPRNDPRVAPAEHTFELWHELQGTADGRQLRKLLGNLLATAEIYL